MKRLIFLSSSFVLLFLLMALPMKTDAQDFANCLKMNVNIQASNWPGGSVNVSCAGDNGPSGCVGSSASGTPGQTVTLDKCSCPPYADGCLQASFPAQCSEVISGPRCGTNGNVIDPTITLTCPEPPKSTPACQVGATCGQNECSSINCLKAYPRKFDINCNCVVDQGTQVDDNSCTQAILCPTNPPATNPPATNPPVTNPPVTNPPATNPPATNPPATNPPATNPPVTNPPVTSPPPPPFNEAMCKCENIEFTPITLGQKTTITAYGKVEGTDTQFAKIPSFNFVFYEGNDASAKVVQRQTVAATQIENTTTKARYKSVWELQIPSTLDSKKVYRIQAKPACVRKTAELPLIMQQTAILGATDDNVGFIESIIRFFTNLFGASQKEESSNLSVQSTENIPSQQPNLQIGTFKPLIATKQTDATNCSFIRLQFAQ